MDITKDDLSGIIKSKYFIVILSNEENLNKCLDNNIAGFPETDNGAWAYLDINEGDYLSFYYNGRIFNLYKVKEKFIPEKFKKERAKGSEYEDPVALPNGDRWSAIKTKKDNIYFPYRFSLQLIEESDYATSLIFKQGFERLGINLVPRVSFKKSHFQLSIKDIMKSFNSTKTVSKGKYFFIDDFQEVFYRKDQVTPSKLQEITTKEIFLQTLLKRILEASIKKYKSFINLNSINELEFNELEFFSEQTVYGGEADLVIANDLKNLAFIEVKNMNILTNKHKLTRVGQMACDQIQRYKDIIEPERLILKIVAGKNKLNNNRSLLRIVRYNDKNLYIIEINTEYKLNQL